MWPSCAAESCLQPPWCASVWQSPSLHGPSGLAACTGGRSCPHTPLVLHAMTGGRPTARLGLPSALPRLHCIPSPQVAYLPLQAQAQMAQQHIQMVEGLQTGFSDAEGRALSRWSSSGQSEQSGASRASQEGQELQNKPGLDSGERDPTALAASGLGAQREGDEVGIGATVASPGWQTWHSMTRLCWQWLPPAQVRHAHSRAHPLCFSPLQQQCPASEDPCATPADLHGKQQAHPRAPSQQPQCPAAPVPFK